MLSRELIAEQLQHTLEGIDLPNAGERIRGKVRDSYVVGDKRILIASDRLSAFDVVLTTIPFKGLLLNQLAAYWFEQTKHIVPNHMISSPHPNVFITKEVNILPVEVIIRGYLAGSAWRDYQAGKPVSGIELPEGLKQFERLPEPLLTPSTKAEIGQHDEPISSEQIVEQGLVEASLWKKVGQTALELFRFGTQKAEEQGLILVDTKYEFGLLEDESGEQQLVLADEVHTQDSSRYWILDSYQQAFDSGEAPTMLDKEFVRRWLIDKGYMGEGEPPEIDAEFRVDTTLKYIEAYEKITGLEFNAEVGSVKEAIERAVADALS